MKKSILTISILVLILSAVALGQYVFKIDENKIYQPNVKIIEPGGCYSENKNVSEVYVESGNCVMCMGVVTGEVDITESVPGNYDISVFSKKNEKIELLNEKTIVIE